MEPDIRGTGSGMPGGVNPVVAVVDTVADIGTSIYNTNKTIKANKEMAKYAYSKDLEMWRLQNEYNSPAAQMQRFKEAGLNPLLIYGQGTSGNATQLPRYQAPKLSYDYNFRPNLVDNIQKFQDINIRQNQNHLLEEQVRKQRADAEMSELKASEMRWRLPWIQKFGSWDYLGKQMKYELQHVDWQNRDMDLQRKISTFDTVVAKLNEELRGQRIKNKWAEWGLNNPGNMLLGLAGSLLLGRGIGSAIGRGASGIGKSKIQYANPKTYLNKRYNNYDLLPNKNF